MAARNYKPLLFFWVVAIMTALLLATAIAAQPIGPTITVLANSTKSSATGTLVNSTINTSTPGGFIFTASLTSTQQNSRWKAYVGNVTGTLTLDDADDNTIFQWTLTSVTGEVYASRSNNINWTGINCTWIREGSRQYNESNRSAEEAENAVLSHTTIDDNITATFSLANHSSMTIGSVIIGKDECFAATTYQNNAAQVFADSDDANFTQLILYDGAFNRTDGNIVYATGMETDVTGYRSDSTYDFQMILPEDGGAGFSSSTGYYFYVELT